MQEIQYTTHKATQTT